MDKYHSPGPNTMPVNAENQTSASPSFFPETKYARRKINRPIDRPAIDREKTNFSSVRIINKKNEGKAAANAARGTVPVLMSDPEIIAENTANRIFISVIWAITHNTAPNEKKYLN